MDLKLLKMLCKDSKQHHVIFHEFYSVSSLLCIAQNVRFEIPYKVLYFETPFFNDIQILCLGFLCQNKEASLRFTAAEDWIEQKSEMRGLFVQLRTNGWTKINHFFV